MSWYASARSMLASFTLVRVLRADRLLLVLTALLSVCTLLPMTGSPFLPFADLPGNIGQAGLIWPTALGDGVAAEHYEVAWKPLPYWSAYLFITVVNRVAGPIIAAKLMVGLLLLMLPLMTMRLLVALNRSPRLGLFAFLLSWEHSLYGGWVTFLLGMNLALLALAWLAEARTPREALKVIPLAAVIALTHVLAVGYLLTAGGLMVFAAGRGFFRRLWLHFVGLSGCLLAIVPWAAKRFGSVGSSAAFVFDLHSPAEKAAALFKYTLDNDPDVIGGRVSAVAFFVFIAGAVMVAGQKQLSVPPFLRRSGVAILAAAALLYLALPMGIGGPIGHWYTYPRFASYLLVGLLLVPMPDLHGARAWWLAPAVLAALALDWSTYRQMRSFGERAGPFVEILELIKPNTRMLPLELEDADPSVRAPPFNQFHGYVAAGKAAYDPHLFDNGDIPLHYRGDKRLPQTNWDTGRNFTLQDHGRYYDYVLVQGITNDPVRDGSTTPEGQTIRLIKEAGRFRLYEVTNRATPPVK